MELAPGALAPIVHGRRRVFCCHSATLSANFPPNSLGAVRDCVQARVPRLELDVRFMADDSMVIFHDDELGPSATMSGRLSRMTRGELAGAAFRLDPGEPICFLEDAVDCLAGSPTMLQVDLKLMRPISARRAELLLRALAPLHGNLIIGSQAHWNLRRLDGAPIAFDPTLQWRYDPERDFEEAWPRTVGVHGLSDDAPIASNPHASAAEYIETRIQDIEALLPSAIEWMVDLRTIAHLQSLGVDLGHRLRTNGRALAAWTLRAETPGRRELVRALFAGGVETIITDIGPIAAAGLATDGM